MKSKFAFSFLSILLLSFNVFSASYTTYQAKIVKPDGYPLEASSVNFKFTILDQAGSCILYSEIYNGLNMNGTGGMISFSLGSGVKTYPVSSPTFYDVFNNAVALHSCDAGDPPSYAPGANDTRKIVMQFHDGSGWQTLPAMTINAVPYAMYANDSQRLGGVSAASFVQYSTIPTCGVSEALQYTGAGFSCVALPQAGTFTAADVTTALNYTPANAASFTTLNNNVSLVSSTVYAVSSTVNSLTLGLTSLQNSVAVSLAAMTSSQWVTSGTALVYPAGNVEVSGSLRISMNATACSAELAGSLRYNTGAVEYCNGVIWSAFGVSGAGLQGLNGSVSGTQSFANATAGVAPAFVTNNGIHTLNIPLASAASVTAGLISNSDYTLFSTVVNKITSSAASIAQVLGYTPANNASLANYALRSNNLSDLSSSATARANLGVGYIGTLSAVDLSSADVMGTLAIARTPAYSGDVTKAAASSSLILSNTGVTAGTYAKVIVDVKGRVTSGAQLSADDINAALGYTAANSATVASLNSAVAALNESQWTTSSSNIYFNTGNVGIGTSTPSMALDVSGTQQIVHQFNDAAVVSASAFSMGLRLKDRDTDYGGMGMIYLSPNRSDTAVYYGDDVGDNLRFVNIRSVSPNISLIESMRITGTGNVGIGTTNPTAKLDLAAGTTSIAPLKLSSGALLSSPQSGTIEFDGTDFYITDGSGIRRTIATATSAGAIDNVSVVSSTAGIVLWPAAGNSVTVSATTASTNSQTGALVVNGGLGVAGNIFSSGTIITSSNIQGSSITATSGMIAPYIAGSVTSNGHLTLDSTTHATKGKIILAPNGGNVGIGDASPIAKLHVAASSGTSETVAIAFHSNVTSATGLPAYGIGMGPTVSQGFLTYRSGTGSTSLYGHKFIVNDTERMRINGLGYVGIGNDAPGALLEVGENSATGSSMRYAASSEQGSLRFTTNSNANWIQSGLDYTSDSKKDLKFSSINAVSTWMTIQASTGNVGIGATGPTQKLDVNGGIRTIYGEPTASNTNASGLSFDGDTGIFVPSDGRLNLWSNNTRTMSLYNSNVGIGTSAPTQRLDVSGTAKATYFMGDGSQLTNLSADNITFYNWTTAVSHVSFSNYIQGVTGFQDYIGTAVSAGSSYWGGITSRDDDTGVQFAVNWNNGGSVPSGFKVRSKDDNIGEWGQWRDVAFIDATVRKSGDTMTGPLLLPSNGLTVGTSQLVVSGGSVGFGTSTPDSVINIVGSGGGDDDVHIDSYSAGAEGTVMLRRARGTEAAPATLQSGDRIGFYTFRGYDGTNFLDLARMQSTTEADLSVSASANLGFFTTYNGSTTEKIRISASGAVGVGTNAPTAGYRLDVFGDMQVGSGAASQSIRFRNANTDGGFIRLNSNSDAVGGTWMEIGTLDNSDEAITFTQTGLERMRIHSNGNVGIGTNAPSTKLAVSGNAIFGGNAKVQIEDQTTFTRLAFNELRFWDWETGGDTMTVSGLNVGVGTTAPLARLEVREPTTGPLTTFTQSVTNAGILIDTDVVNATHSPGVFWRASNSSPTKPKAGMWMYQENGPGSWLLFGTSNSYATGITNTALAINPSGWVGIGTTTPDDRFVVNNGTTIGRYTTGGWTHVSDARYKHDIKTIDGSLEKVLQLRGVQYKFNNDPKNATQLGFIAQEAEKVFPEVVETDSKGFKSMIYANLVAPVVESIKQLFQRILGVEEQVQQQKREIAVLKEKSENLEQQNKMLKDYLCEKDPNAKICQ